MKQHLINIGITLLLGNCVLTGCKKDNYEAPNASLQGKIIDQLSNTAVPLQTLNGAVIRYYQLLYSTNNPNPINGAVHHDGTYENAMLFSGKYKIVAEGPFYYNDTITVDVNGNTQQDILVKAYLQVTASASDVTANSVTIKYTVKRNENTQKIAHVSAVIGTTEGVDVNNYTFNDARDVQAIPDPTIEATTYEKVFTGLKPNTVYYLRAAARTANVENPSLYFNYTPVIKVKTGN
jgi:hypothetical protein